MEFKCWPSWTTLFCLISLSNHLVHFKPWEKRLEIWLTEANILVEVKVSDVQYSLVSWGNYSDWNAYLSMSAFPPDYQKHCHSLNVPFPPDNGSSSILVPEQQQAWVWVWAAEGWGALCGGTEVCGWVFRLGFSDVHGAVALLSIQSDSHSSLLLFIPIYTYYKQVLGGLCRFPSVPV